MACRLSPDGCLTIGAAEGSAKEGTEGRERGTRWSGATTWVDVAPCPLDLPRPLFPGKDDVVVVVVVVEEEEEEDESDEDEEKFAELPSTLPCRSPHPPYSPEFYINSHTAADFNNFESKLDEFASDDVYARRMAWEQEFKRRLNKISDRVDRLLESSAKER